ncbi:hypothetical protein [Clostridium massiliamazoniense]|uniref:hypothetical protein n=1 Tax=Clostridium massiliamazoniense TaxID=1347366 RepID=UPI0006D79A8E|nr:hypothetical protein [Clostridium massiliamazoniense]
MSYVKTKWKDKIVNEVGEIIQEGTPLSAENLNNIEAGIEENTEQLLDIKQETEVKENQIVEAIKNPSLEGCGLKYLVREDAEICISGTAERDSSYYFQETTVTCPANKLMYIISIRIIYGRPYSGSNSGRVGNFECTYFKTPKFSIQQFYSNLIFAENLFMGCGVDPYDYSNGVDVNKTILIPKPIEKFTISGAEVSYVLLDKDKGGIDYNDFN